PNDSDSGSVKICGSAASVSRARPAPSSSTDASFDRAVSPHAGPAVDISADFTWPGDQNGCSWRRSAAAPLMCGVAMLVPLKTANGAPANSGSVDERISPPGAEMSGFSSWPNGVTPPDEKIVIVPPRPVSMSSGLWPIRIVARPPVGAIAARSRAPSRSETMPAGTVSGIGIGFASPARLSTSTSPIAPAARARADLELNVQIPRETRAIAPVSEPRGSVDAPSLRLLGGPQRCDSTGLPSVPTIVPTSTSFWSTLAQAAGGVWAAGWNGIGPRPETAGLVTVSAGAKTWLFETAATLIASGAVPGEPTLPSPKSSRSLPAAITGRTPAATVLATVGIIASFTGSVWGPPPEKLMTFIPSATADSKAATSSGVSATLPPGLGRLNTR